MGRVDSREIRHTILTHTLNHGSYIALYSSGEECGNKLVEYREYQLSFVYIF